ncbi:SulP family inorganic anion transporter [Chelatococcus sambhunathii]|uniref:SulP family inorganic anion transporter n=1 Tax=Chelatococcus sambhunathii TaxID=363953 RepID=A0ABU1DGG2_9HYPH|nr:SulP family inorganic anion transporter [Chelatococcus sambhunathii]MDR4307202.1 SulP family inorganic anion transporter [Chelatococcus sambhunathii]
MTDHAGATTPEARSSSLAALRSPAVLTRETLAGAVTALALIPEVISFSFITGVDPKSALIASVVLGLIMSLLGGRPAMVTAAAGSVALVVGPMVKAHGVGYILPAVLLAGAVQIAFGLLGLARMTRFIPRSVMIGFVNSLGILIFLAQVPHVLNVSLPVYALFALTVAIVLATPRLTTAIPAPLVAIVIVTAITIFGNLTVPNVGGEGSMAPGLPGLTPFLVPLDLETLSIVWPTALSIAFVGLLETLLTAKLVDELTDTPSHKGKECWALGLGNIASGFYGGVAGCAMIGQTVVNVKFGGGRTRISTAVAAIVMLALVTVLSDLMAQIPMVALAAVMMIVAIRTFNWRSVAPSTLKRMPVSETLVLALTTIVTVATGNLALGIASGALLAMVLFARRVAHVIRVERTPSADGASVRYTVYGPLFFGSSNDLVGRFSYGEDPAQVTIDLTHSQIWDASTVAALDSVETKYQARGSIVTFTGLDQRSTAFHERLRGQLA